jgi:hypothetical protein
MINRITLKWGTLKGWKLESRLAVAAMEAFVDEVRLNASAMLTHHSAEEREALCKVIDVVWEEGGEIWNDWNGRTMTAEEAKAYVREYSA